MGEEDKQKIHESYKRALQKGERFWPDSIFKDVIMAFGILILLILLATFIGIPTEPKADPSDTAYVPRPEWYFLFLFKFLALYGQIPLLGKIEWPATVLLPGIVILIVTILPFLDRNPHRYYSKRLLLLTVMGLFVVSIVSLTLMADIPTNSAEGGTMVGILQVIAGLVIPATALVTLILLSYVFKSVPGRAMVWVAGISAGFMIALTAAVLLLAPARAQEETAVASTLAEQIIFGQDLYSVNCVECHGDDGKVTKIVGVEGLEGKEIMPINSHDVLYTLDDASLFEIIAYGRPDSGMTPFGKAYGGVLSKSEMDYITAFMRYMWDDRFEIPAEALKPIFPPLIPGEVPSYDVHIAPIVKRYCLSCHRAGKQNNNYLMGSYEEILNTGDNVPLITAGDPDSIFLKVIQEQTILDPATGEELIGVMPPNGPLQPNVIEVFMRWVMNGMTLTAEEASALFPTPTPGAEPAPAATPPP
jgi:mono/diheme cytochrome c family protein